MAMPPEVKRVLDRFEAAKSARALWDTHWQDLADVMRPVRADFTQQTAQGDRRTDLIYDSTPLIAVRGLASAVEGLLMPKTERWFHVKTGDEDLDEQDDVKEWLEDTEERMWRAIYAAPARFAKAFAESFLDLVTFGTGPVFIGESRDLANLVFRAIHLKDAYILTNADGLIDTTFLKAKLTARQAAQRYGEDNLGEKTKEALSRSDREKREEKFEFVEAIFPREDARPGGARARDLPVASVEIDIGSEHKIRERGYHEFPMSIMRWDTAAGEDYGRSPAMLALPDSLTLQQMQKTILMAGHKAVDPPLFLPSDSMVSAPRTFPGGNSYFDVEALAAGQLRRPFFPLETGANLPLGLEMQNQTRDQVFSAFFKNVLNLPTEGPQMTATEIIERKQEFVRTIGPTFGRLEADGPAMIVERVFGLMARAGRFREPPESIQGRIAEFEYESPVERIRKKIEAFTLTESLQILDPLITLDPTLLDHFDADEIARDVPEGVSMPSRWLRSREDVDKLRQVRAQQEQAQQAIAAALAGAKEVSEIERNAPGMVERIADAVG